MFCLPLLGGSAVHREVGLHLCFVESLIDWCVLYQSITNLFSMGAKVWTVQSHRAPWYSPLPNRTSRCTMDTSERILIKLIKPQRTTHLQGRITPVRQLVCRMQLHTFLLRYANTVQCHQIKWRSTVLRVFLLALLLLAGVRGVDSRCPTHCKLWCK